MKKLWSVVLVTELFRPLHIYNKPFSCIFRENTIKKRRILNFITVYKNFFAIAAATRSPSAAAEEIPPA